ncbi:lipopolysaccharide heptosyltransferase II [Geomonas sp.]|uniref:lipopolysaccharide heptosyltransferase II n=1 Tax=Geomonas sp. TaxID=2651584 RepID=UPI002B4759C8|nr:lipopolysaccharide heptosyltransferase II [Geomonas sp.]
MRKILVRSVNWLGDAVMITPALGAIRRHFPDAEITVLANPLVSQMFANHPSVDKVITFERGKHRGLMGRLRLAGQLRQQHFDLAIIFTNSFEGALIPWLAGIPLRAGKNSDGRGLLLTHPWPKTLQNTKEHQVLNYLDMVKFFGIPSIAPVLSLATTTEEDGAMAKRLAAAGIAPGDFVLGVNPGATFGSAKRWYPERFAEVARGLSERWGARVVITGGSTETEMAARIQEQLGAGCLNLAGATSVRELMALIKRCNFFITNDSGPMHIAAAFDVPLVAIFGSTDHRTTSAFFSHGTIVRHDTDCAPCMKRECPTDHRCMTAVTASEVIEAADALFGKLHLATSSDNSHSRRGRAGEGEPSPAVGDR